VRHAGLLLTGLGGSPYLYQHEESGNCSRSAGGCICHVCGATYYSLLGLLRWRDCASVSTQSTTEDVDLRKVFSPSGTKFGKSRSYPFTLRHVRCSPTMHPADVFWDGRQPSSYPAADEADGARSGRTFTFCRADGLRGPRIVMTRLHDFVTGCVETLVQCIGRSTM